MREQGFSTRNYGISHLARLVLAHDLGGNARNALVSDGCALEVLGTYTCIYWPDDRAPTDEELAELLVGLPVLAVSDADDWGRRNRERETWSTRLRHRPAFDDSCHRMLPFPR